MKSFIALFALLLCLGLPVVQAQDFSFSQYHNTPLLTNPGMLGNMNQTTALVNYRNQRLKSGEQLTTPMLSLALPIFDSLTHRASFGLTLINDDQAKFVMTNGGLLGGAFNIGLGRSQLSIGLQGGYFQRRVDANGLSTDSQFQGGVFNPSLPTGESMTGQTASFFTAGGGLHWSLPDSLFGQKAFAGVSYLNLNEPDELFFGNQGENRIPARLQATLGIQVFSNHRFAIMPNARYIRAAGQSFLNAGSWVRYFIPPTPQGRPTNISLGIWYNTNEFGTLSAEWDQGNLFAAASYDLPLGNSAATFQGNGIFELTIGVRFARKAQADTLMLMAEEETAENQKPAEQTQKDKTPKKDQAQKDTKKQDEPQGQPTDREAVRREIAEEIGKDIERLEERVSELEAEKDKYLKNKVRFELGSNRLTLGSMIILEDWVIYLRKNPSVRIVLEGHTCDLGEEGDNHDLSRQRAEEVKLHLVEQGIDPDRIETVGAGPDDPYVPNTSEFNRQLNRRVDIIIKK